MDFRRATLGFIVAVQVTVAFSAAAAVSVSRGPYLQRATPESIVVRWRTDAATSSFVRYGTSLSNLTTIVSESAAVTDHNVAITNLLPDTKYYYQVGHSTAWFAAGSNHFFVTSPRPGPARPTRIWALGDSGTADENAADVRDAYAAFTGARKPDVWLMLGDNAYDDGTDAEYQDAVFEMYPTFLRNTALWPTIGNHEVSSAYFDMFSLPRNAEAGGIPSGTENYYSFDYANIHFICLDSYKSDNSSNGPMCDWLRMDLEATTQEWIIAFWHHPPYTKGSHDSDTEAELYTMRRNVVPILEGYGVDLVLCGHSHSYERSFLLDGHYGNSSTFAQSMKKNAGDGRENGDGPYRKPAGTPGRQGAVYTVAGSSARMGGGDLDHPAMFASLNELGSLVIDINGNRLDLIFLENDLRAGDYFTMIKTAPSTNAPAAPSGLVARAIATNRIDLSWLDNADNEESFKIERSTNGIQFVQFAVVGANVTNGADVGLAPGTTYYYRLRASNVAGDSPFSGTAQATTPSLPLRDTTAPAAVTNLLVSNVTSNTATLSWVAPGDDGNTGTAARYDLRYSTAIITEANWPSATQASGEPAPAGAGSSQGFTVGGLLPNRTYYFALKTSDETNNLSPLSNIASAMTRPVTNSIDNVAPAAIADLFVSSMNSNSVTLSWTAPGDDGNAGTAARYDVRYATTLLSEANWASATQTTEEPAPLAPGSSQSVSINGLVPGGTYHFALKTADEANNLSPLSSVASASTVPAVAITGIVLIASNTVWKYLDNGSDQNRAWVEPAFNDSNWLSGRGKFGYGFGDETTVIRYGPSSSSKYITTYFRRTFNLPDAGTYTNLLIQMMRDDGAVVFINGVEVYRSNMPGGTVTNRTLAASDVSGSGSSRYYTRLVSPAVLVAGMNTVAVELHQASPSTPDMSFDLQLTGRTWCSGSGGSGPLPALSIYRQTTNVLIRWPVTCAVYVLEQSGSLDGQATWSAVNANLSVVNGQYQWIGPSNSSNRFYRLRRM